MGLVPCIGLGGRIPNLQSTELGPGVLKSQSTALDSTITMKYMGISLRGCNMGRCSIVQLIISTITMKYMGIPQRAVSSIVQLIIRVPLHAVAILGTVTQPRDHVTGPLNVFSKNQGSHFGGSQDNTHTVDGKNPA